MLPTRRSPNDVRGWVFWAVPEKTRHRKPWNLCGNGETRRICLALPFAKAYRTRKSRKCHPETPPPPTCPVALSFLIFFGGVKTKDHTAKRLRAPHSAPSMMRAYAAKSTKTRILWRSGSSPRRSGKNRRGASGISGNFFPGFVRFRIDSSVTMFQLRHRPVPSAAHISSTTLKTVAQIA